MKKAYIQPEFDLLKLSSNEDILFSVVSDGSWGNDDGFDLDEDFNTDPWN